METEGEWVEFFTGDRFSVAEGGRWLKDIETPLERMPVFVRNGAVIPIYPDDVDSTDDMDMKRVENVTIDDSFRGFRF